MSTQITTGKVRFSYCNLFTPRAVQEGATPKYSVTLLIPKSDKATMQKIKAQNITNKTRPKDFERNQHIHNCWIITHAEAQG